MQRPFTFLMTALPLLITALAVTLIATVNTAPMRPHHSATVTAPELGGVDSLDVCVDGGTIHLLIGENGSDGDATLFRHTRSEDGGVTWSTPVIVNAGARPAVHHHRGADARIIARGNRLFAAWTTPGTGFKGTGPMGAALSSDGGRTWQPGPDPADHASTGSHRFLALAADHEAFHLIWLDDRNKQRGLRHARSTNGGRTWSANATLDDLTCACCWNTLLYVPQAPSRAEKRTAGTLFALYRDMKPSDMGLARSDDGGRTWTKLGHVGDFGWHFDGCPHVGGGIAMGRDSDNALALFATVWTGQPDSPGCHLLTAGVTGAAWMPLGRIGGDTARHPTIAARGRHLCAAWDEVSGDDRAVFAITSSDGGRTWTAPRKLSAAAEQASHVRLIANPTGKGFLAIWTRSSGSKAAALAVAAVPAP